MIIINGYWCDPLLFQADAEEGLVKGDTSDEPTTYGSADTGATDKPPPFDAVPGEG